MWGGGVQIGGGRVLDVEGLSHIVEGVIGRGAFWYESPPISLRYDLET